MCCSLFLHSTAFKLDKKIKYIFNIKSTKWNLLKFVECVYYCFSNKSLQVLTFQVKLESKFLVQS